MTPEEFLNQHAALSDVAATMQPYYALIKAVRDGFVNEAGLGPDAADLLTVEWVRTVVTPMLAKQAEAAA